MTPPPPPVSFAAKQQALQANQGRPLDPAAVDNLRRSAPPAAPMVRTMQVAPGALRPAAQTMPNDRPPAARAAEPPAGRPAQAVTPAAPPAARPAATPPPAPKTAAAPKPPAKKPAEKDKKKEDK
jgi:hypothetical protein